MDARHDFVSLLPAPPDVGGLVPVAPRPQAPVPVPASRCEHASRARRSPRRTPADWRTSGKVANRMRPTFADLLGRDPDEVQLAEQRYQGHGAGDRFP
jgi:hypothetical protein